MLYTAVGGYCAEIQAGIEGEYPEQVAHHVFAHGVATMVIAMPKELIVSDCALDTFKSSAKTAAALVATGSGRNEILVKLDKQEAVSLGCKVDFEMICKDDIGQEVMLYGYGKCEIK